MLEFRLERTQDEQDIRAVLDSAFESADESRVVDLLRQSGHATISLVAVEDDRIAGHILFSPVVIHPSDPDLRILGLAPVAVHPDFQGRGIGTQLIQYGLSLCREKGYAAVVVLGHPGYYPRFGFRPASEFGIGNEYGVDEAFMVLEIREGILKDVNGTAHYRQEFKGAGV